MEIVMRPLCNISDSNVVRVTAPTYWEAVQRLLDVADREGIPVEDMYRRLAELEADERHKEDCELAVLF